MKKNQKYLTLLLLLLPIPFTSSCSLSSIPKTPQFFNDPIFQVNLNPLLQKSQNLSYINFDRIILLKKVVYHFTPNNQLIFEFHQISKIIQKPAQPIQYLIHFKKNYQKILKIDAYSISQNQKKSIAQIQTSSPFFNQSLQLKLYQSVKLKSILFPNAQINSLIHLRYQIQFLYSDFQKLIEGQFYLASQYPTLKQKFVLVTPQNQKIWLKFFKTSLNVQKKNQNSLNYYIVEQNNVPLIHSEPFQKNFPSISPKLTFSSLPNLQNIQQKFPPLFFKSHFPINPTVRQKALQLTQHLPSLKQKIQALYHFVTSTRHISNAPIPLGMDGYIPNAPHLILKEKYADSKDKAFLLFHLLNSVGAKPQFAFTNESFPLNPKRPILKTLNRILIALKHNQKYLFLDPYSVIARYGFLPPQIYGKSILIFHPKHISIQKIPFPSPHQNQITYQTQSSLNSQGHLQYQTSFFPSHSYEINERIRMIHLSLKNPKLSLAQNYQNLYQSSDLVQFQSLNSTDPFDLTQPFQYQISFQIKQFAQISKSLKQASVQPKIYHQTLPSFSRHRIYGVNFTLPFKIVLNHTMKYPPQWLIQNYPKNQKISSPLWHYQIQFQKITPSSFLYSRSFVIKVPSILKKHYPNFKKFMDQVAQTDQQKVVFSIKN